MGEVHFMISEAAKRVNVETHVLRYWEEELELTIGRTEMGHRYYTEEDVRLFNCIKELKEQGLQLKELKELIPDMLQVRAQRRAQKKTPFEEKEETNPQVEELSEIQLALLENNKVLQDSITQAVIKEMGFLFQANERQEEDRYKKLDALIRQQQSYRKESARSAPLKTLRRIFEA
ncbi:MAG: MerR family transcriptional regulator [Tyzzerella sp.]|nr:MerR family transcriptional regulator [Tyzzerella sp.]